MLILHLSDIHFRKKEVATALDPNFHLRNEIVRDVADFYSKSKRSPDAIIITGDIAFAGHPDEFAFARTWLIELTQACGANLDVVFTCPGNHDADRSISGKPVVQSLHKSVKDSPDITLTNLISGLLIDPEASKLLYEPLGAYNFFAQQFFCDLLPPDRTRATRDLLLNDGSILRLWGINTAFISSASDKKEDLFYDSSCLQISNEYGVTNLVMGHHPPSWLRMGDALSDHLNSVAKIQMFGHVHSNRIDMVRDYVRFSAGAAHPDRAEPGWEPGYNWIELDVEGEGEDRHLNVQAHVRVWQSAPTGFRAKMDGARDVFRHQVPLEAWVSSASGQSVGEAVVGDRSTTIDQNADSAVTASLREISIKFYGLPFSKKLEIAGRLQLLEDSDIGAPDFERFRRVFLRAQERGLLSSLSQAVEEACGARGAK